MKRMILIVAAATMALGLSSAMAAETSSKHYAPEAQQLQKDPKYSVAPVAEQASVLALAKEKLDAGDVLGALMALLFGAGGVGMAMTTLAVNKPRTFEIGNRNELPVIDNDILYEGSAIGLVAGTGDARPLAAGDRFCGFAEATVDNTVTGHAAGGVNVRLIESGKAQLSVTGVTITDFGQPVYATDDDTFTMSPVAGVFIGFVHRFISSGVAIVAFDALNYRDPWHAYSVRETISADKTLDAEDTGKLFWVDTDAKTITLPAIAAGLDGCAIVNGGSFGTVAVNVSPNASDGILGPDITSADNKDLINTKATAQRGDFVVIGGNDADGNAVQALRGTWVREA